MHSSRHAGAPFHRPFFGLLVMAFSVFAVCARAQHPRGADTISASAAAESLAVVKQLKERVLFHYGDTTAWHRLGIAAWVLADRARAADPPQGVDGTRMGRLADSSLRIAAALAPLNVDYRVDVGRFLLDADVAITRVSARTHFEKALGVARKQSDPELHAKAALLVGRTYWWRYDIFENRRMVVSQNSIPRSVSDAMQPAAGSADATLDALFGQSVLNSLTHGNPSAIPDPARASYKDLTSALAGANAAEEQAAYHNLPQTSFKDARQLIEERTSYLPRELEGAADFERSYDLFGEAYAADPTYPGAFRGLAMIYADRGLWVQLELLARNHLRIAPRDSLAWMSLGLAAHRLEKDVEARAAFDTALQVLGPEERDRLDNWRRVTPLGRGLPLSAGTEAERSGVERLYWMLANPIWADNGAETKIEFLARVTYAELRWTVEEFGLAGADTDRGDIHVRYGPADKIIVIGPSGSDQVADVTTFWIYNSGLMFAFRGMPTFATAHTAYGDGAIVDALRQVQPVRWDNIVAPVTDSIPVQLARFRAGVDSVDVVVSALLPAPDSIRKSMEVVGDVRDYFWLLTPGLVRQVSEVGTADTGGVYGWSHRVAQGSFLYRVEEFGETAKRAGRATGTVDAGSTAFPLHGFGISDLLVASGAESPAGIVRWTGMQIVPAAGIVQHSEQLAVVWENYELSQRNGSAEYDATLTLKREHASSGRIGAQIAGVLASIAKRDAANANQVIFSFARTVPYAPAFADHVTLSLGDTPAGTYSLTLELTDRVTGAKVSRTTQVIVR